MFAVIKKTIDEWVQSGVPEMSLPHFMRHQDAGTCTSSKGGETSPIVNLVSHTRRPAFPTYMLHTNVREYFSEGFCDRLAGIAIKKYKEFGAQRRKKQPDIDPNDLNDAFFSYQITSPDGWRRPEAAKRWPELYKNSKDFKLLAHLMAEALREYMRQTGLHPPVHRDEGLVLWAAIYPGDGGRHGYHVHQGSLSSCVFYAKTSGKSGPIVFADPRGAPPVNDYEQHLGERDFEPKAPFHRHEYVFPDQGDIVCFPSWLVHQVPSHWESEPRVAFAANLQAESWDAWHRTAQAVV